MEISRPGSIQSTCGVLLLVIALTCPAALGQSAYPTSVTLAIGLVESYVGGNIHTGYAAYPEVDVSTRLFNLEDAGISVHGGLFAGGWIETPSGSVRCVECSPWKEYTARAGLRTAARLDHAVVPLRIWIGGAYHGTWRWVRTFGGPPEPEGTFYNTRFDAAAGARLELPLGSNLWLVPGARVILELPHEDAAPRRFAFMLGLSRTFGP